MPATTNGGEGQHHWTKQQTGSCLSLLEAILLYVREKLILNHDSLSSSYFRAREVDRKTANEIRDARELGTLVNSRNDLYNRMSRNTQRVSATMAKSAETKRQIGLETDIRELITAEKAQWKESLLRQKQLEVALQSTSSLTTTKKAPRTRSTTLAQNEPTLHANSSGKVCTYTKTKGAARAAADPYPIQASQSEVKSASQGTSFSWFLITITADILPLVLGSSSSVIALSDITGMDGKDVGFSVADIALPYPPAVDVDWNG